MRGHQKILSLDVTVFSDAKSTVNLAVEIDPRSQSILPIPISEISAVKSGVPVRLQDAAQEGRRHGG